MNPARRRRARVRNVFFRNSLRWRVIASFSSRKISSSYPYTLATPASPRLDDSRKMSRHLSRHPGLGWGLSHPQCSRSLWRASSFAGSAFNFLSSLAITSPDADRPLAADLSCVSWSDLEQEAIEPQPCAELLRCMRGLPALHLLARENFGQERGRLSREKGTRGSTPDAFKRRHLVSRMRGKRGAAKACPLIQSFARVVCPRFHWR